MENTSDYDSPWKDILDQFFEDFMEFYFAAAAAQIDWARGYEFLDKELQKITADAAIGRRTVDKLIKVWLKNGSELWVLIHVEVQGQRETDFTLRVYVYHYRIFDRYHAPVATFVILADEDENWRPSEYREELLGTKVTFEFPAVKLLDYRARREELEQSDNVFAVVTLAQLAAMETRGNARDRFREKFALTRRLYEHGFDRQRVIGLLKFIDWGLTLPEELQAEFHDKLSEYEEEHKMPYVTSFERIGIEKGMAQGMAQGKAEGKAELLLRMLERRFGALDELAHTHIHTLPMEQIEELSDSIFDFGSRADLEEWLRRHPVAPAPSPGDAHNGSATES